MTDPMMDRIEDAYEHLIHDVQCMLDSELYARWRADQQCFNLSIDNIQRVLEQMPNATRVATEANWKEMGRTVNAAADPILILAPRIRSPTGTDIGTVAENYGLPPAVVEVYDISQTHGLPLLTLARSLTEDTERCNSLFRQLTAFAPAPVVVTKELSADYCGRRKADRLLIREGVAAAQGCVMLAYWIAQARNPRNMHDHLTVVQNQAVAYVVLRCLGVDSSKYSVGFIVRHGCTIDGLEASREVVVAIAHDLITEMEGLAGVQQQDGGIEENSGLPL